MWIAPISISKCERLLEKASNLLKTYTSIFAIFIGFSLGLLSCTSISGLLVSDKEMNKQGSLAFRQIKAKTPIEKGRRVNTYVRCIAKAILEVTKDDTGVKVWEVVVFKNKTPNAFALPGGKIGVHTGILTVANSPGQLAAIMGHEVGHVIARHSKQRYAQNKASSVGAGAVGAVYGAGAGKLAGAGLTYGFLLPFSRSHETEADVIGLELMSKAGFDPRESVKLWQNMSALSKGKAPSQFLSTHPSGKTRIKDLQAKLPKVWPIYMKVRASGKKPQCRL